VISLLFTPEEATQAIRRRAMRSLRVVLAEGAALLATRLLQLAAVLLVVACVAGAGYLLAEIATLAIPGAAIIDTLF
jgi:hypothetical protein